MNFCLSPQLRSFQALISVSGKVTPSAYALTPPLGEVRVYRSTIGSTVPKSFLRLVSHTPPLHEEVSFFAARIYPKLLLHRPLAPKVMKQTKLRVAMPLSSLRHLINSSFSHKAIIIGEGESLQSNPDRSKCNTILRLGYFC